MNRRFVLAFISAAAAAGAWAGEGSFTQTVKPDDLSAAGLDKLSPAELAKLDQLVEDYKSRAVEEARRQAGSAKAAQPNAEKAGDHAPARAAAAGKAQNRPPSKATVLVAPGATVEYQPVESRILGSLDGWDPHSVFMLENGQCWTVANNDRYYAGKTVDNPKVVIRPVRTFGGFKMSIEGIGEVRVRLLREAAPGAAPPPPAGPN